MLEETTRDVVLEPLDDWIVVEPLDESETASGLIVPINEGAQTRQAIVAAVGPEVESIDPGDKVLFPRDAGFEVRLARSAHRVRVLRREDCWPASTTERRTESTRRKRSAAWIELPPREARCPAARGYEPIPPSCATPVASRHPPP